MSGRNHTPAKGADVKASRGFESLRVRQNKKGKNMFEVLAKLFSIGKSVDRSKHRQYTTNYEDLCM